MENKQLRIEISVSNGKKLVAKKEVDDAGHEDIIVFLEENGEFFKEIAFIGENYDYANNSKPIPGKYYVWNSDLENGFDVEEDA